jgi:hypothetical protein
LAPMEGYGSEPVEVAEATRAALIDAIRWTDVRPAPPLSERPAIQTGRADFVLRLMDDARGRLPDRAIPLDRSAG